MIFERNVELHPNVPFPQHSASTSAAAAAAGAAAEAAQPSPHKARCLISDPCHVFNANTGVNLSDTAAIVYEAYKHCSRLHRGGHAKAASGSTDLRLDVFRRVTRDSQALDCVVAAAYRPLDSPHWKQSDPYTCQACSEMCDGKHTKPGRDWSHLLEECVD